MTGPQPCESLRAVIREDLERMLQAERSTPTPDPAALSGYRQLLQEHTRLHVQRQSAAG
jgi:hypothetical protein